MKTRARLDLVARDSEARSLTAFDRAPDHHLLSTGMTTWVHLLALNTSNNIVA